MLSRFRAYAQIFRLAIPTPVGTTTLCLVALAYMGLFLWLSGMLIYNSQINHLNPTPAVYYDLNPKVMQPYLLFFPTPESLVFVDLTGAVTTMALSGLVGLNAALFVRQWRRATGGIKSGTTLLAGVLPTLVPNLGLGCCPSLPLLLSLLPSSATGVGLLLGSNYGLTMSASVLLMLAATIYTLERICRANLGKADYQPCELSLLRAGKEAYR